MNLKEITDFVQKNQLIALLFVSSLLFFLYQHTTGISWDFSAYVLNSKYWLGQSGFFEWMRPPLTSFIMTLLSVFGWPLTEYAFIVFVSLLFLIACLKFSKAFSLNRKIFYALMLTPLILNMGFSDGSELLTLSLLMLAISYLYSYPDEPVKSSLVFGFFMGLAFLCRYESVIFFLIFFFKRPNRGVFKDFLFSISIFLLVITPWLIYNQILTGSWVTSMADLYAIHFKFRGYMNNPPDLLQILAGFNYYLPLFLMGIWYKRKSLRSKDLAIVFIFTIIMAFYVLKPTKMVRYLFNLTLPLACFSTYFVESHFGPHMDKIERKIVLLILSSNLMLSLIFFLPLDDPSLFRESAASLEDCKLQSNGWVFLNYYGMVAEPHSWDDMISQNLAEGNRLLLFRSIGEPEYTRDDEFLSQFPVIESNEDYILLGNGDVCLAPEPQTKTYLDHYVENNKYVDSIENCEIFFPAQICEEYDFIKTIMG